MHVCYLLERYYEFRSNRQNLAVTTPNLLRMNAMPEALTAAATEAAPEPEMEEGKGKGKGRGRGKGKGKGKAKGKDEPPSEVPKQKTATQEAKQVSRYCSWLDDAWFKYGRAHIFRYMTMLTQT